MSGLRDLTDDDLHRATSAARGLAHRAPFAEYSLDHKGHTSIVNHTDAWMVRGRSFAELAQETRRRGLVLPDCDCPPASPCKPLAPQVLKGTAR